MTTFPRRDAALVGEMQRAGVSILAGTDEPNPFVIPGFCLHEELGPLVHAGLTPLEALRAATLNPARFLEATDSLGTVAPGKVADLVLLDASPLGDIANSPWIAAVVVNGRYLDRPSLEELLAGVERLAAAPARGARTAARRSHEEAGLLAPDSRVPGHRREAEAVLPRLVLLRFGQGAGFTIAEIGHAARPSEERHGQRDREQAVRRCPQRVGARVTSSASGWKAMPAIGSTPAMPATVPIRRGSLRDSRLMARAGFAAVP